MPASPAPPHENHHRIRALALRRHGRSKHHGSCDRSQASGTGGTTHDVISHCLLLGYEYKF